VLLSHVHWDHVQGIPFFSPIYMPGTKLHFVGGVSGTKLRGALEKQMTTPMFPVEWNDLPAAMEYAQVRDRQRVAVGSAEVTVARANHPDAVFAYRIDHEGSSVVYATDTEHYACVDHRLVSLAKGADVLIYDAQYLPEEYAGISGMSKVGWGHSTYAAGIELARAAGVKKLVLFHHDPTRTDAGVREVEALAKRAYDGDVSAAREGSRIVLGARRGILAA
jgi:phosphoribosyl 1,2-cyclic phosphodiesterase